MGLNIYLDFNNEAIKHLCNQDKTLSSLIHRIGPLSYEIHDENPYKFIIHEIIEQMLSIKAGNKIFERLMLLCKNDITPEAISTLSDEDIKSIGTSNSKVQYIRNITEAVTNNSLNFEELNSMSNDEITKKLTSIKGIGKWTANMYLIFVLNRPDVLPTTDVAFIQAFKWLYKKESITEKEIKEFCKKWHPYSSIASRYLYRALDSGLTKESSL